MCGYKICFYVYINNLRNIEFLKFKEKKSLKDSLEFMDQVFVNKAT